MRNTLIVALLAALTPALPARAIPPDSAPLIEITPAEAMPGARDYGFLWWADGWRGRSPQGERVVCVRTGHYGLALDVEHLKVLHFGPIAAERAARDAVGEDNATVFALPPAELKMVIKIGERTYHCTGVDLAGTDNLTYPVRLIESGSVFQRFDIQRLIFEDDQKHRLDVDARLEVAAWPHELRMLLEAKPRRDFPGDDFSVQLVFTGPGIDNPTHSVWAFSLRPSWPKEETDREGITTGFGGTNGPISVSVTATRPGNLPAPARFLANWDGYRVELPTESWSAAKDLDHLERIKLQVQNPTAGEVVIPLRFTKDESFEGVTGMCPMLRDRNGYPTGIPVQVSKNWHQSPGRTLLCQGPWFHGSSLLRMPPRSKLELEFALTYARWGGVPGASFAQLCLVGWGVNQRWDQSAIGSWGESICYDPDVCLNRSMIDDVRPLMVWGMGLKQTKWSWTNNVGGGDFLVYEDPAFHRQYLSRMRALYTRPGPCLSETTYAGVTPDGSIAARITVGATRSDDLNRGYHRFRYDVLEPTRFRRLAFYQTGADHYNDHQFGTLARGNVAGLIEEWTPARGGQRYSRPSLLCEGDAPWFSLHKAESRDPKGGAWANRALVIRHWKARLGGRDVPTPFAAVYGTDDGIPSTAIELVPPPGLTELKAGDFAEGEVEFVVIPMSADDYYGPNQALRKALRDDGNTWKMAHREAAGNQLKLAVTRGRLVRAIAPVEVDVDRTGSAELSITGGLGYVPITFRKLASPISRGIWRDDGDGKGPHRVDQSVHGADFWQAGFDAATRTWSLTYNVPLDAPDDRPRTVRLELRPPSR